MCKNCEKYWEAATSEGATLVRFTAYANNGGTVSMVPDADGKYVLADYANEILSTLRARLAEVERERDELQQLIDLQHTRTVAADKAWQIRHGKPNVMPDLGELIDWMWAESKIACESAAQANDELEAAEARVEELEKALRHIPIDLKCPASHFRATGCVGDKCTACGLPMIPVNNDLRAALHTGEGEEKKS